MKKYDYISAARGIGIILVVLGHIILSGPLYSFSYAISIPLFFFLSGFVFNNNKYDNFSTLIKSKWKSLILPYLVYAIITYLYWILIEIRFDPTNSSLIKPFIQIFIAQGSSDYLLFNPPLWFVPCIFATELLFFCIKDKVEKCKLWMLFFPIIGIIMSILKPYFDFSILPYSIDVACTGLLFFIFGNQLKKIIKQEKYSNIVNFCNNEIIFILLLLLLIVTSYTNGGISMGHAQYNNYFLFFLNAVVGIYIVFYISYKYFKNSNYMKFLGDNSFTIMALHFPLKKIICFVISKIAKIPISGIYSNSYYSIISTIIVIIIISGFIYVKNKIPKLSFLR